MVTALNFMHSDLIWKQLNVFTVQENTRAICLTFCKHFWDFCNYTDMLKVKMNFKQVPFSNKPMRKY